MFPLVSLAPSKRSGPGASRSAEAASTSRVRESGQDDDELFRSFSSDDEDRKRNRRTVTSLVLDPLSNAMGFPRWRFNFNFKICEASRHDSTAIMAWILQVEKPHVILEDLDVSDKRWDDLDVVLAAAIVKVVNNLLLRDIMIHQETQAQQGKLLQ